MECVHLSMVLNMSSYFFYQLYGRINASTHFINNLHPKITCSKVTVSLGFIIHGIKLK